MKWLMLVVLGVGATGCLLSRAEQAEWRQIAEQIEQFEPQLLSLMRAYAAKEVSAKDAARQVAALAAARSAAQKRQLELAEERSRNFWGGAGIATNILLALAMRGLLGSRARRLTKSIDAAKDALWPRTNGVSPPERMAFNEVLAAAQDKSGIRGWVDRIRKG